MVKLSTLGQLLIFFRQNKYWCPYVPNLFTCSFVFISYVLLVFGDENKLKAFTLKTYQGCHNYLGSEFKQDYFFKEGLVCGNVVFFKAVLNIGHSQDAADLDDSALWEQGSRSLTGNPGDMHAGDRAGRAVSSICCLKSLCGGG